ncbi:hypothetical protein AAG570_003179 [Ranatra chinensis]|uniref:Uncharacterized protein n=1 Tax=Ranatra chinensis TaxID=642074 RepID=A0ABD0Y613_9HEMI
MFYQNKKQETTEIGIKSSILRFVSRRASRRTVDMVDDANDGKDGPVTSQDVALVSKPPSKLPVPEKARTDVLPPATHYDNTTDMLTKDKFDSIAIFSGDAPNLRTGAY